jgi:hypothetical protein
VSIFGSPPDDAAFVIACSWCFATNEHAEMFRDKFGGEWFEPKNGR